MADLDDLERRFDGPIPADLRERALNPDAGTVSIRQRLNFWRGQVAFARRCVLAGNRFADDDLEYAMKNLREAETAALNAAPPVTADAAEKSGCREPATAASGAVDGHPGLQSLKAVDAAIRRIAKG